MNLVRGLVFLCLTAVLASCGQKGALYLPNDKPDTDILTSKQ